MSVERKRQAYRFAILTARSQMEPQRLTFWQKSFLEGTNPDELMMGDRWTVGAYRREYIAAGSRVLHSS